MILSDTACFWLGLGFAIGMFWIGNGIGNLGEALDNAAYRAQDCFDKWLDRVHPEPVEDDDEE